MSIARDHHWIPQFYLKRFTDNGSKNSRLFAYDLRDRKHYLTTPAKACKQRDFNRIQVDGIAQDALEASLAAFESNVAAALRDVIEDGRPTGEPWLWVLNWMAVLAARNPIMRMQLESVLLEVVHATLEQVVSSREAWMTLREEIERQGIRLPVASANYEGMRDFVLGRKYILEFPHGHHVPAEFSGVDAVIKSLVARHWQIVRAEPNTGGFVTSDRPVTIFHEDGTPPWSARPLGYAMPHTLVIFPLTPELLAIGHFDPQPTVSGTQRFVCRANMLIVVGAGQRVFAPHNRFRVEAANDAGFVTGAEVLPLITYPRG